MGELVALSLSKRRRINMLLSETLLIALGTSVAKYLAGRCCRVAGIPVALCP